MAPPTVEQMYSSGAHVAPILDASAAKSSLPSLGPGDLLCKSSMHIIPGVCRAGIAPKSTDLASCPAPTVGDNGDSIMQTGPMPRGGAALLHPDSAAATVKPGPATAETMIQRAQGEASMASSSPSSGSGAEASASSAQLAGQRGDASATGPRSDEDALRGEAEERELEFEALAQDDAWYDVEVLALDEPKRRVRVAWENCEAAHPHAWVPVRCLRRRATEFAVDQAPEEGAAVLVTPRHTGTYPTHPPKMPTPPSSLARRSSRAIRSSTTTQTLSGWRRTASPAQPDPRSAPAPPAGPHQRSRAAPHRAKAPGRAAGR